jgi:UDP-2,3-diacylglucosamine hydrolase
LAIDLELQKKIYFASDFHLGVPNYEASLAREKKIIRWLENVTQDAQEIWLLGDLFDFWFDYKKVVPRGFVRLLGTMAKIVDEGTPIVLFAGNHDMWFFDYMQKEIGVLLYREPVVREWNKKRFLIGHGDGLGPGDHGYKFVKKVFANPVCQWLFRWIHPDIGIGIANFFSGKSRASTGEYDKSFLGRENEWLVQYCEKQLEKDYFDYFIFGHRHLPLDIKIGEASRYINLGEWIHYFTYAVFDGQDLITKAFETDHNPTIKA